MIGFILTLSIIALLTSILAVVLFFRVLKTYEVDKDYLFTDIEPRLDSLEKNINILLNQNTEE